MAVLADIDALGELAGGVRRSLAQVALVLARGCDECAKSSERVAAARELRATLMALVGRDDSPADLFEQLRRALPGAALPAVVGHAAGPVAAESGPGGGGGGDLAEGAADAAPAAGL